MNHRKTGIITPCSVSAGWLTLFILPLPLIFSVEVMSANVPSVTVKIKVVASPCILNGGKDIEVDFKDISPKKVNGMNHLQTIGYTLDCEDNLALQLRLRGETVAFDTGHSGQVLRIWE